MRRAFWVLQLIGRLYGLLHYGIPLLGGVVTWIALHVFTGLPTYLVVAFAAAAAFVLLGAMGLLARLVHHWINTGLADECDHYARALQTFLSDQDAFELTMRSPGEEWSHFTGRLREGAKRLMDRYRERYESDIVALVETLLRRGIRDEELDQVYQHPLNSLGIQTVAQRLAVVARRLRER